MLMSIWHVILRNISVDGNIIIIISVVDLSTQAVVMQASINSRKYEVVYVDSITVMPAA